MEPNEPFRPSDIFDDHDSRSAVNSLILEYYKKFGRQRDLEQYFSLTTAQSDVRDPCGLFWRKMKAQDVSPDSSGKKSSESSTALCISVTCAVPDQQNDNQKAKSDSESPPIVIEETKQSDEESVKSGGGKSMYVTLDTSSNKPLSPTSSITSQRKLEWDSLADVGYANETDRKTVSSSLSTIERLALKQHYKNNDNKDSVVMGSPEAHSTPTDAGNVATNKNKTNKKGLIKKTREIQSKNIDKVEVNIPQTSPNMAGQPFSVNLTKHISFSVEKNGGIVVEHVAKDVKISPAERVSMESEVSPEKKLDKEIQTSLTKSNTSTTESRKQKLRFRYKRQTCSQTVPILISLNTLKRRIKRRKTRSARKRSQKKLGARRNVSEILEKSGEQVSEAESFEYMPGHIYNQNQMIDNQHRSRNSAGNKSSLESSAITTESSKTTNSFTKDLERNIKLLCAVLQRKNNLKNVYLKNKLVEDVVNNLLNSKYRDDESTSDFTSKRLNVGEGDNKNYTTTSTSDVNNTNTKPTRPRKSILRLNKFNANAIASTSQSAPNLPTISNSEKPVLSAKPLISSNTESDVSSTGLLKTSSEEFSKKERYKRHLIEKEKFLKEKLVGSDNNIQLPTKSETKIHKLKDLMKDLARNNYNDGSGDASKLEGGSNGSQSHLNEFIGDRKQRSNSVFTLSSGNSNKKCPGADRENRKINLRKRLQEEIEAGCSSKPGTSKNNCSCSQANTSHVTDNPIQVDDKRACSQKKSSYSPRNNKEKEENKTKDDKPKDIGASHIVIDRTTGKIVHCAYSGYDLPPNMPENLMVFKCMDSKSTKAQTGIMQSNEVCVQCAETKRGSKLTPLSPGRATRDARKTGLVDILQNENFGDNVSEKCNSLRKSTQSSQTDLALGVLKTRPSASMCSLSSKGLRSPKESPRCDCDSPSCDCATKYGNCKKVQECILLHEITRITQTDISINPKIPDPSLSDISIVSEADCCKVISESYREVPKSKTNVSKSTINRKNSETQMSPSNKVLVSVTPGGSQGNVAITHDFGNEKVIEKQSTGEKNEIINSKEYTPSLHGIVANADSYSIPYPGTNMTLMVSIGTKQIGENKEKPCLQQDRLKALQYQSNYDKCPLVRNIGTQINSSPRNDKSIKLSKEIEFETDATKKSLSEESKTTYTFSAYCPENVKHGTYPNVEKKPFIRTNTDTAILNTKFPNKASNIVENKPLIINDFDSKVSRKFVNKVAGDMIKSNSDGAQTTKSDNLQSGSEKSYKSNPCVDKRMTKEITDRIVLTEAKYRSNVEEKRSSDLSETKSGTDSEKLKQCGDGHGGYDKSTTEENTQSKTDDSACLYKDPIMEAIKDITRRYSKKSIEKSKKKKYFKEILSVFNYLLDTEDATDADFRTSDLDTGKSAQEGCECMSGIAEKLSESTKNSENDHSSVQAKKVTDSTEKVETATCKCGATKINKKTTANKVENEFGKPNVEKDAQNTKKSASETSTSTLNKKKKESNTANTATSFSPKKFIDKAVQLSQKRSRTKRVPATESSVSPRSTDLHDTSTDTKTCNILSKIKKECDKYQKRRCKCQHGDKKTDSASTTSRNCDGCNKTHHCCCKGHAKCKAHRHHKESSQKKSVAYNLIIQTSDSMVSEETPCVAKQHLQNIVVKVPPRRPVIGEQFGPAKSIPSRQPSPPISNRGHAQFYRCTRSRSLPHESEISSTDDYKRAAQGLTVRDYLEKNRPDFVEKASERQNVLKIIGESRSIERDLQRELLSLQVERGSALSRISSSDLRRLAQELGIEPRRKKCAAKFISERDMKKHSEAIYKTLPEVVKKKEKISKENNKKSNMLMASIFKKNLQRKTLRGSVNLSNYSTVIKI